LLADEKKSETFSFESGKIDEISSDLAALILQFKDLRDKKIIKENMLEKIVTIYQHLHMSVVNSTLDDERIGKQ
jgi:hypothetical protein